MLILDQGKNDTSSVIDLLRALAAQAVCVGHAISFFKGEWAPTTLPLMQNLGVLLFFVLSGFLIAHTLQKKVVNPEYGLLQYALERFSRIYSGLLPALAFIVFADAAIGQEVSFLTLLANVLMNEGYRGIFPNALPREPFGSAPQLWTLAIEWHIYFVVGAAFFIFKGRGKLAVLIPVLLFYGQTPAHYLWGAYQADGVGRGLFALWLAAAATYFMIPKLHIGRELGILLAVAGFSLCIAQTGPGEEYRFSTYILLLTAFVGIVCWSQRTHGISFATSRRIRFAADYSFTLYLTHHTVMVVTKTWFPQPSVTGFVAAILVSNLLAMLLAEIGEKQHCKLLSKLLTVSLRRPSPISAK